MKKLLLISLLLTVGSVLWGQEQVKFRINGEFIEFVAFNPESPWIDEVLKSKIAEDGWIIDWGLIDRRDVPDGIRRALLDNGYFWAFRIVVIDEYSAICYQYEVSYNIPYDMCNWTTVYYLYKE